MHVTAIIARRRGGGWRERLETLLSVGGREILERSVTAFLEHPDVNEVVVALPPDVVADPPDYLRSAEAFALRGQSEEAVALRGQSEGLAIQASGKRLRIVAGGGRRQDSVANAFRATGAHSDIIVIHDAARPFASAGLIARRSRGGRIGRRRWPPCRRATP
jgi:4-diphosphocytidyl-2-methyl-D-erithritol synthase